MSPLWKMLALVAIGCGSAPPAPATRPEPAPVDVPDAADEQSTDDNAAVPLTAQQPSSDGSLADCAAALRASPGLGGSAPESEAYARAFAFERDDHPNEARKAYYEIVSRTPTSPYVPFVYLAFGEMFAREASGEPARWELARQAYREVLKYPPPQNPAWAYTQLRVAEIDRTLNDRTQALSGYVKVVEAVRQRPDTRCGAPLLVEARRGAVLAFADAGAPDRAYQLFKRYDAEQSAAWLSDLVDEYLARGKQAEACAAAKAAPAVRTRAVCP